MAETQNCVSYILRVVIRLTVSVSYIHQHVTRRNIQDAPDFSCLLHSYQFLI